jgi:hypothetical protein
LYSKLSKCYFYQKKIHYLGHIISEQGIAVDPEKIEAIRGFPKPRSVSDVRYFMGLVGYYRRFIVGFYNIYYPITSLQKKGTKFEWTLKCEENFNLLKELLTSAPVLKIVDQMKVLWYVQTHVRKDLGESSRKMDMSLDMSPEILRNMRGTMPRMTWNLLPLFMP